jgi:iron complex outermembrane receptor protein
VEVGRDRLTVFADAGGSDTDVSRLSDQTPTIVNGAGDTLVTPNNFRFKVERSTYNAGLRAKLDTGPVRHAISFMGSLYSDRNLQASVLGTPLTSNIYHPITRPEQHIPAPRNVPKVSSSDLSGLAQADTMSILDERAQLTLGLRQQRIESRNFNAVTGVRTVSYDESATTPLAGLVVKPWSNVSLYANYVEGLSKGDVAPATASNAGQVFKPYKARQKEVGVKVEFDSAMLSLSAFEITKPSGQLTNGVYGADSEQRNRGLEMNLSGEPLRGLRLLGGVTWLDAELTRTNSAATLGNQPVGVPKFSANLSAEWDTPWVAGLTLTGGMVYTVMDHLRPGRAIRHAGPGQGRDISRQSRQRDQPRVLVRRGILRHDLARRAAHAHAVGVDGFLTGAGRAASQHATARQAGETRMPLMRARLSSVLRRWLDKAAAASSLRSRSSKSRMARC